MPAVKKVLIATEKPFSADATKSIEDILTQSSHKVDKLEGYKGADELVAGVNCGDFNFCGVQWRGSAQVIPSISQFAW